MMFTFGFRVLVFGLQVDVWSSSSTSKHTRCFYEQRVEAKV